MNKIIPNRKSFRCALFVLAFLTLHCSLFNNENGINTKGVWAESGLQEVKINTLKFDTGVFLVTTEVGVYKKEQAEYRNMGLTQFNVADIVKLDEGEFLSAIPFPKNMGISRNDTVSLTALRFDDFGSSNRF